MKLNLFCDEKISQEHVDVYYANMQPMVQQIIDLVGKKTTELISKYEGETIYIPVKDIFYLESVDKKAFAYTEKEVYPLSEPLAYYEQQLTMEGFVRVGKSTVVNVFHIKELKSEVNMRIAATFRNGEKVYINRSYKAAFLKYLKEMRGEKHE